MGNKDGVLGNKNSRRCRPTNVQHFLEFCHDFANVVDGAMVVFSLWLE